MKLHKKINGKNKVRQIIERTWQLSLLYGFFSISFVRTPCQWYWNAYTVNTNQWKHLESHVKQNNAHSHGSLNIKQTSVFILNLLRFSSSWFYQLCTAYKEKRLRYLLVNKSWYDMLFPFGRTFGLSTLTKSWCFKRQPYTQILYQLILDQTTVFPSFASAENNISFNNYPSVRLTYLSQTK